MRNYLKRLKLNFPVVESELDALTQKHTDEGTNHRSEEKWRLDAQSILSDTTKRQHYERVHFQYSAMKATLSCLRDPSADDTNRWHLRLEEFDLPQPELLDGDLD